MINDNYLSVSDEVREAIDAGGRVVALESTIISHGMPYPRNLGTALEVEKTIRERGCVPATIAITDGVFRVGLSSDQLEVLATSKDVKKASRRDVGAILAKRETAATTVATTMIGARLAGISVFATGGTGGVHRGASDSFDVSADLHELARTPVLVVSAGVKSILDIPKTLETLETLGVPVFGWKTDEFPAFYTRNSGLKVPLRADDECDLARALSAQWTLGFSSGAILANPIPESAQLEREYMESIIQSAIQNAEKSGISGSAVTPFLLAEIVEQTGGQSLEANIALVMNNALVAAKVAVALSENWRGKR